MLFNSIEFAFFFAVVYCLYLVSRHRRQNRILLAASCVFYGTWDWRFLLLLVFSASVDYFCALKIRATEDPGKRRAFLILSIAVSLGILGFFKYFNFFTDSFRALIHGLGIDVYVPALNVILPVGISFYTFQAMSYVIDVYRGKLEPTRRWPDYLLFVMFFPHLVAGPIQRAHNLLVQIQRERQVTWPKISEGSYLIFWGWFQKVYIADTLAPFVDSVFNQGASAKGAMVLLGVYAFAFQIFCDFAGYSDMARGLAKCMGFELMVNFNLPYFAANPQEFWRRWHISLSEWFRDYLYVPLGGNRGGTFKTARNLFLTMALAGLWHGAAWTFAIWGVFHGALLALHRAAHPILSRVTLSGIAERVWRGACVIFFFHLVCLGWLIFRSQSLSQAAGMAGKIFTDFAAPAAEWNPAVWLVLGTVWILLAVQWLQAHKDDLMAPYRMHPAFRTALYYACIYSFIIYGVNGGREFIYFRF